MPRIEQTQAGASLLKFAIEQAKPGEEGKLYESRFETVLNELLKEGVIDRWEKTERHSDDDNKAIDYKILADGVEMNWQITSTPTEVRRHRKKHESIRTGDVQITNLRRGQALRGVEEIKNELRMKTRLKLRETGKKSGE